MKKIAAILTVFFYCNVLCAQVSTHQSAIQDTTRVFIKAEIAPEFKGGDTEWINYIRTNLNSVVGAKNGAPIGNYQVIVRFIVSTTGVIRDVAAETNFGFGMEQEAVRVIKNSPAWTPARQNGNHVNFYLRQPVTFVVVLDGISINSPAVLKVNEENEVTLFSNKLPVEFIEFEITNDNGSVSPSGPGKYIFKPSGKGAVLAWMYIHLKRKKKKITAVYFKAE